MAKGELKIKTSTVAVGRLVLNEVRKAGANGITFQQLKEMLKGRRELKVAKQDEEIKLALQKASDRGILKREGDCYKMVQKVPKRKQKITCVICIKEWSTGCKRLMTLPCGHVFCRPCIQKWLKQVNTCPSCRTIV